MTVSSGLSGVGDQGPTSRLPECSQHQTLCNTDYPPTSLASGSLTPTHVTYLPKAARVDIRLEAGTRENYLLIPPVCGFKRLSLGFPAKNNHSYRGN